MKTIFQHIEYVKGKPHHVRKQVALATATGITAVVALVWFFGTLSSGTFAIQGSSFADSTSGDSSAVTGTNGSSDSAIAGAAAAVEDQSAPAHIEIVDTSSSTSSEKKVEPTVIPF